MDTWIKNFCSARDLAIWCQQRKIDHTTAYNQAVRMLNRLRGYEVLTDFISTWQAELDAIARFDFIP